MAMFGGIILFLIGLASFISLLVYGYKEFKADESNTSQKVLLVVIELLEFFSGIGGVVFALLLSFAVIIMGLGIIWMLH